jgi:hypothetical protein
MEIQPKNSEIVFIKEAWVLEVEYPGIGCRAPFYSSRERAMPALMIMNHLNKLFVIPMDKSTIDKLSAGFQECQKQVVRERLEPSIIQVKEHVEELSYDREKA